MLQHLKQRLLDTHIKSIDDAHAEWAKTQMQNVATQAKYVANAASYAREDVQRYIDHGVHYRGAWHMPQGAVASQSAMGHEIADEMGWRYAFARPWYNMIDLTIPLPAFNRGLGVEFALVADRPGASPPGSSGIYRYDRASSLQFQIYGEAKQMFESWYASCYHNPDVIKAITRRGKAQHKY